VWLRSPATPAGERRGALIVKALEPNEEHLRGYGELPIAFTVCTRYRVEEITGGAGGWRLVEEAVCPPFIKDYDAGAERPLRWQARWDISNWIVLAAMEQGARVGGAVVAWNTPGADMLEGRDDLAVLWDLRVHPDHRRTGIGTRLFAYAAAWARAKGCRQLKVETQDINVRACKFYAKQGCTLRDVQRGAYPEYPDEVRLLWYLDL